MIWPKHSDRTGRSSRMVASSRRKNQRLWAVEVKIRDMSPGVAARLDVDVDGLVVAVRQVVKWSRSVFGKCGRRESNGSKRLIGGERRASGFDEDRIDRRGPATNGSETRVELLAGD